MKNENKPTAVTEAPENKKAPAKPVSAAKAARVTALDLTADLRKLEELAASGQMSAEDIADTVEGITGTLTDKLDNLMELVSVFEGYQAVLKERKEQAQKREKMWSNQIAAVKQHIKLIVESSGKSSLRSPFFTYTIASGRQLVSVPDASLLPDNLYDLQTNYMPRMDEIKEILKKLKSGEAVEGFEDGNIPGVVVSVSETSLRIS